MVSQEDPSLLDQFMERVREADRLRPTQPPAREAAVAASFSAPKSTTDIPAQLKPAVEPRSEDWDICRSRQEGIDGLFVTAMRMSFTLELPI